MGIPIRREKDAVGRVKVKTRGDFKNTYVQVRCSDQVPQCLLDDIISWRKQPMSTLNRRVGLLQALDNLCGCLDVLNSTVRSFKFASRQSAPSRCFIRQVADKTPLCLEEREREGARDVLSSKESTCFGACSIAARLTRGMSQVYCQKVLSSNHSSHLTFLYRGKRLKPEQVTSVDISYERTPPFPLMRACYASDEIRVKFHAYFRVKLHAYFQRPCCLNPVLWPQTPEDVDMVMGEENFIWIVDVPSASENAA